MMTIQFVNKARPFKMKEYTNFQTGLRLDNSSERVSIKIVPIIAFLH